MTIRGTIRTAGRTAALAAALAAWTTQPAGAAELMTQAQREQAVATARQIAADPAVVAAAKAQNARKVPLAEIQQVDRAWLATRGLDERMRVLMDNDCARALKRAQAAQSEISEAFVMDDQGANVCMTNRTSDYWQGDEAKWKESFGRSAAFVDKPAYDESAQAYLVQVSVPVMAGGKAIGAVTIGINLARLAARR